MAPLSNKLLAKTDMKKHHLDTFRGHLSHLHHPHSPPQQHFWDQTLNRAGESMRTVYPKCWPWASSQVNSLESFYRFCCPTHLYTIPITNHFVFRKFIHYLILRYFFWTSLSPPPRPKQFSGKELRKVLQHHLVIQRQVLGTIKPDTQPLALQDNAI